MLIATLPAVHRSELLEKVISHPLIKGVRYNTGYVTPYSPKETLKRILELIERYGKILWIDLKCRQLRIANWAVPDYGKIILNHEIEVDCPARVYFRGNEWSEIKVARGNVIYVDPPPKSAVGEGQAINIHGDNLKIKGFLTDEDRVYINAACGFGINKFMLSFVECIDDIKEAEEELKKNLNYDFLNNPAQFILKIESLKGLEFVRSMPAKISEGFQMMAARDDLMINIGENKAMMLPAIQKIIMKDPNAIVASRIFSGLENDGTVSMADFSDLKLMKMMGYKNFMLSDGICQKHFGKAMKAWQDFHDITDKD
ncbi:hypothetical protein KAU09_04745 [Candidatus Parcubacteria bacterium]|nr:hypothetical protein [Candidatus Parcubacteria bacterium]